MAAATGCAPPGESHANPARLPCFPQSSVFDSRFCAKRVESMNTIFRDKAVQQRWLCRRPSRKRRCAVRLITGAISPPSRGKSLRKTTAAATPAATQAGETVLDLGSGAGRSVSSPLNRGRRENHGSIRSMRCWPWLGATRRCGRAIGLCQCRVSWGRSRIWPDLERLDALSQATPPHRRRDVSGGG